VAGLFVMVSAVEQTGLTSALETRLRTTSRVNGATGAAAIATGIALVSDVLNNLPAGWLASAAVSEAHPPKDVVEPLLTGVDLGANLSITGSLATLLWLTALRREGIAVGFWRFLKVGRLSRRRR
jgi:arsenical pump membrane protein